MCEITGRFGVRASELCDLRIDNVPLQDPDGARSGVPGSMIEAESARCR